MDTTAVSSIEKQFSSTAGSEHEYLHAHHDRDVIYSLRTAHQAQTQLLMLADQKANILIGVVAVILTIIFTKIALLGNVSQAYLYAVSAFSLMQGLALFFAMMVIVPQIRYKLSAQSIADVPNPFYFGFFTKFSQDDYVGHVVGTMKDNLSAREFLARDLYQVGKVLNKKYTQVRYAYVCSIVGVVVLLLSSLGLLFSGVSLMPEVASEVAAKVVTK